MSTGALRVTAIAGGVGAARMLAGLSSVVGQEAITAIVNTGDDTVLHGLCVSPDLDTVTYTLAGVANAATGWGLAGETWATMEALSAFEQVAPASLTWFSLGDKDLATHLFRTGRIAAGASLSEVTAEVAMRFGVRARLLPMTDDLVQTRLTVEVGARTSNFGGLGAGTGPARAEPARAEPPGAPVEIGFQEYFVGLRHSVPIKQARFAGIESSRPAPGVLEAIEEADVIVICPSNPIVSIGPVMAVPGVAAAVAKRRDRTVAVSPIIAGRALKGPADRMLAELGLDPSAAAVAGLWSPWASAFVVDEADAGTAPEVEARGMRCVVARSVMSGPLEAANLAKAVLNAGMGG